MESSRNLNVSGKLSSRSKVQSRTQTVTAREFPSHQPCSWKFI